MKRSAKPMKRTPLKQVSQKRKSENAQYLRQRWVFLIANPICGGCVARKINPAPSNQVHHMAGREGELLCDESWWLACCADCHTWIHANMNAARELGLAK